MLEILMIILKFITNVASEGTISVIKVSILFDTLTMAVQCAK